MPRTPDPEVGGSSPTRVKPCCVLEQGTFTPQKVLVIPRKRWLRPNMTEKLFTGTLRINQPTITANLPYDPPMNTDNNNYRTFHTDYFVSDEMLVFTIFVRREASACLIVQRTKQGSHGYHFYRLWYGAAEIQTK